MAPGYVEREPLARHTVFGIGGEAAVWAEVASTRDVVAALDYANQRKLGWTVLGAGSNVLVADRGFPGMVMHATGGTIRIEGTQLAAEAGVSMARLASAAVERGLGGVEWAVGIPGTVGGSVVGNAGCFGGEVKDRMTEVEALDATSGKVTTLSGGAAEFSYRESFFKRAPNFIVLSATFQLERADPETGGAALREFTRRRVQSQDIGARTAGCMFKNVVWSRINRDRLLAEHPELIGFATSATLPAGFLIESVGLKGRRSGGAKISSRHGNFIINRGGASAEHVLALVRDARHAVAERYGIELEEEFRRIGFDA